jgi:hypothetical protein
LRALVVEIELTTSASSGCQALGAESSSPTDVEAVVEPLGSPTAVITNHYESCARFV